MHNIYIIDFLGTRGNIQPYLLALKHLVQKEAHADARILSNYGHMHEQPFFMDHYNGPTWKRILKLYTNLRRLDRFISEHPNDIFIHVNHGTWIDVKFMRLLSNAPNHIVDLYSTPGETLSNNEILYDRMTQCFSNSIQTVISHSQETTDMLEQIGYDGDKLNLPVLTALPELVGNVMEAETNGKDITDIDGKDTLSSFGASLRQWLELRES